ncbi:MAG: hypothetical protein PWQ10_462 [Patescibacteria group bacterium]|nr:hypothetical protein [Patescibacteria group bacterium]
MSNITINSENNQEKNQKTTPVTESFHNQSSSDNSLLDGIVKIWLGWRDSNPRMSAPKADALPLGDIPLTIQIVH